MTTELSTAWLLTSPVVMSSFLHYQPISCFFQMAIMHGHQVMSDKYLFTPCVACNSVNYSVKNFIFIAVQCYGECGYATVCLPVTLRYCDHIGWNTSKIISCRNRLRHLYSSSTSALTVPSTRLCTIGAEPSQ